MRKHPLSASGTLLGLLTTAAVVLPSGAVEAQDWRTLSSSRQVASEQSLEVEVSYAAGELRVVPAESGLLYRADLRYDARVFEPNMGYRDGRFQVEFEGRGVDLRSREGGRLELGVGPDVPLDLEFNFGAGRAVIELGGLSIEEARIATGASQTDVRFGSPNRQRARNFQLSSGAAEVRLRGLGNANAENVKVEGGVGDVVLDFTGRWSGNTTARVDMGLGSLRLILPRDLGVRVQKSTVLSSFDSSGFEERDGEYFSSGWGDAEHRLTLVLNTAFSSIDVDWVEGSTAGR